MSSTFLARSAGFAFALEVALAFGTVAAHAQTAAVAQATPATTAASTPAAYAPQMLTHGLFTDVQITRPAGTPQQFVMLVLAGDAPTAAERTRIQKLVGAGAMVAAIPLGSFYRKLEAQDGKCTYAGGAFENLSRHIQAYDRLPTYLTPMLAGSGANAAFVYSLLATAPAGTFSAAISAGFCPRLTMKTPPCATGQLRWQAAADGSFDLQPAAAALPAAWTAIQSASNACPAAAAQDFVQRVPQAVWLATPGPAASAGSAFDAAYAALATRQVSLGPPPAQLADLPIVEVPATGAGNRFAVLLSGDGGWASIDKGIAAGLVARGIPVAGFDSLRYFWTPRTPEGLAIDLDRVIRYYAARWKRSEVVVVGYSQGADVLPFAITRLPAATRSRVRLTALIGLGQKAAFEFHVSNWIGPSGDIPIAPEVRKLDVAATLCIHGRDERESLCPELVADRVRVIGLPGDHHFNGDHDGLAARIVDALPK